MQPKTSTTSGRSISPSNLRFRSIQEKIAAMKSKLEQLNQSYKKALGGVILKFVPSSEPITVTDVLIDPSFQHGWVWVNATPESLKLLEEKRVDIQNQMQRHVKTRYTPKLQFIIDDRYLDRMEELFTQVNTPTDEN